MPLNCNILGLKAQSAHKSDSFLSNKDYFALVLLYHSPLVTSFIRIVLIIFSPGSLGMLQVICDKQCEVFGKLYHTTMFVAGFLLILNSFRARP